MAKALLTTALFASLPLTALSSPMPISLNRRDDGPFIQDVNCDWTSVDIPAGWFFCFDSAGENLYCDQCSVASSADGVSCYEATDDENLGNRISCPGDPAPAANPDGSPTDVADGLVGTFCKFSAPGIFSIPSSAACFLYSLLSAGGDPLAANNAGLIGVCDTLFVGACTFFKEGYGDPEDPGCVPPEDNPDLCSLANPGK